MAAGSAFATEALAKRFGGVVATDMVSLDVPAGELRCIIGPNGAGKSTLFSLLCGIYRPDQGRILLDGRDVTALPPFRRVRLGLGLTFQTNRAFHASRAAEPGGGDARPGAAPGSGGGDRYRYAVDRFGLDPESAMPARELPHHQLQWLEIAMVLASGPTILLLDEPTAGMSPDETMQTARVLQHLNRRG